ncbi:MAG: cutinase family protein [Actinobacteria bacterium]|uniref:Unannotated protein n=1 Tax=freshwater metagenome TaxID=449393 RepID=A0A6J6RXL0_9ZZZZ|nr:cutinase family protein [Actinomycetota bacterium]
MHASRTLGLLLATICASILIPTSTTAATAATASTCSDIYVLGARGSGQYAEGGDQFGGYGPQVFAAVRDLEEKTGASASSTSAPVTYPAWPTSMLVTNKKRYFEGIDQGVANALQALADRQRRCPTERLVLAGYSSGAMVVHRVVRRILDDRTFAARLDGVLLIADGDRVANDNTVLHGTAPAASQGLGHNVSGSGTSPAKLPLAYEQVLHSICNKNDSACGGGVDTRTHSGYQGSPEVVEAVDDVVERVAVRFPRS